MPHQGESQVSILVVDREEGIRGVCRQVLTLAGYRVDTATNLSTALDLMQSSAYDLYLLGVPLPDGSALDLLTGVIEHEPNAVCLAITGPGRIEMAGEAIRHGACGFLSKPFTSDELLLSVGQGLEWRRLKAIEAQAGSLEQARDELERLDKAREQLMLRMAHELRAPATAVMSYVNLLLAGYLTEDELRPTLSRIQERLQEMLDLIADLLELARLRQTPRQPLEGGPQDMADILIGVCDLFRQQTRKKGQSLQVEILDNPFVSADRTHLEQIWTNLISNAVKYTEHGGQITVRLQSDEDSVSGTVLDTGIGIAGDDQQRLFEDFFRTEQAKASGEPGTGLGLSIVRQIVESYGGEIRVTSTLGRGSQFTFRLPKKPGPASPMPIAQDQDLRL